VSTNKQRVQHQAHPVVGVVVVGGELSQEAPTITHSTIQYSIPELKDSWFISNSHDKVHNNGSKIYCLKKCLDFDGDCVFFFK